MLSRRLFVVLLILALVWALPVASAFAAQGCSKQETCEAPSKGEPEPKEDPNPDRGNPSPGTPPEEPPGNPNPGDKNPDGGTDSPTSGGSSGGGGSSPTGGGGGSQDKPTSSGSDGDGGGGAGAVQPNAGGDMGPDSTRSSADPRAKRRPEPNVGRERSTRGPRRVIFEPADGETGTQLVDGDVLDVVANASHVAAFPLFLALIVAVFLLVQDRIDRADPKLAGASRTKDYLTFD